MIATALAAGLLLTPVENAPACAAAERLLATPLAAITSPADLASGEAPPFRGLWKRARELRQGGWSGPVPTADHLDRWEASAGRNATECPNVKALASAASASPRTSTTERQVESYVVGSPVLNGAGTAALAQITTNRSGLGGSVYLFLLYKTHGEWTVVSRRLLLIS